MIVNLKGKTCKIYWEYKGDLTLIICDYGVLLSSGITRHPLDVPNRPLSRRISLKRLFRNHGFFSREDRRVIWQAYFAQHRDLRLRPAKVKSAPVAGVGGPLGGAA